MTAEEIRKYCENDNRTLRELVNSLIERKGISKAAAKKYFGVNKMNELDIEIIERDNHIPPEKSILVMKKREIK